MNVVSNVVLTNAQCLRIIQVQRIFDAHSRMGVVRVTDKTQMQELLRDLGFDWNLNDVMTVCHKMDLDHSDTIDFREFYQWYVHIINDTFVSCFSRRAFGFVRVFLSPTQCRQAFPSVLYSQMIVHASCIA